MGSSNTFKTLLGETFLAPAVDSYVIKVPHHGSLVLRERGNYPGIDLSGANLSGLNLSGINLEGAKLENVDFSGTNLSYANLAKTVLSGANLANARLDHARLDGAVLKNVTFAAPPSGIDPVALLQKS
jgi:uncharacterized protein YjbI with pentapeptide repeats